MTPEEKAVLDAALKWSIHEMSDRTFDGFVEAYRKSLEPQARFRSRDRVVWSNDGAGRCNCDSPGLADRICRLLNADSEGNP